jgi:hypothetical protein
VDYLPKVEPVIIEKDPKYIYFCGRKILKDEVLFFHYNKPTCILNDYYAYIDNKTDEPDECIRRINANLKKQEICLYIKTIDKEGKYIVHFTDIESFLEIKKDLHSINEFAKILNINNWYVRESEKLAQYC